MLKYVTRCIFCAIVLNTIYCRKYDINQEANKLYGEDLKHVLQRFRRTPEYLKILKMRIEDLQISMKILLAETFHYYQKEMTERITKIFGGNATLRNREFTTKKIKRKTKELKSFKIGKRTGNSNLDEYSEFKSALSVEEKNRMRDLAYEYAGKSVHAFINNFATDDTLPVSTQQPGGGDHTAATEHHHEVTKYTDIENERDTESGKEYTTEKEYYHSTAPPPDHPGHS